MVVVDGLFVIVVHCMQCHLLYRKIHLKGSTETIWDCVTFLSFPVFSVCPTEQLVRDYGKENVRRLREIQRRCKEQEAQREHSRPVPVKALWSSPKYQDIPSRVMAQLQVRGTGR